MSAEECIRRGKAASGNASGGAEEKIHEAMNRLSAKSSQTGRGNGKVRKKPLGTGGGREGET